MVAIIVSLILLIFLSFKKINIVVVGILAAAVMALLSGQPVLTAIKDSYMMGQLGLFKTTF